jgi:predicted GNAT family N-acyltransferase
MHSNWVDIAEPESRDILHNEIITCELLGETADNKSIFLFCPKAEHGHTALLREIGRLREQAFRLVGEGTGLDRDVDSYDLYYMHIILWDSVDQEIVGAYRLCRTEYFYTDPKKPIYTSSLFEYLPSSEPILKAGLELGRSFVQEKYWGSRSLDYLWSGIAAFLRRHPEYRYLLGAVSISNDLSLHAKEILVGFYRKYFDDHNSEVRSEKVTCSRPFLLSEKGQAHVEELFRGLDYKQGFKVLKKQLRYLGYAVPMLYKQYTELTEKGGTEFLDFSIDPDFNDCIDGLVVVDITQMTEQKRKRYGLKNHSVL